MSPQEFIKKAEQGTITDEEMKIFLTSISEKLVDLKQKDPATYLKTIGALGGAMDSISDGLEAGS